MRAKGTRKGTDMSVDKITEGLGSIAVRVMKYKGQSLSTISYQVHEDIYYSTTDILTDTEFCKLSSDGNNISVKRIQETLWFLRWEVLTAGFDQFSHPKHKSRLTLCQSITSARVGS